MILSDAVVFDFREAWQLLIDKLQGWFASLVRSLPNFVTALLVLALAFFIARFMKKVAGKLFGRLIKNKAISSLLASIVFAIILLTGIIICLGILNLDKTVTSLLAGAGIIGLALTFAFQDVAQNFISGVSMAIWRPFNIGDTIEAGGKRGVVKKINLRTTILINSAGELVIIPNKEVYQNVLINSSQVHGILIRIPFEMPADSDLESGAESITDALEKEPYIHNNSVNVLFTDFTAATIKAEARFFINHDADDATSRSNAIITLRRMLTINQKELAAKIE
jgi:small-conductance mechanosensitive channel